MCPGHLSWSAGQLAGRGYASSTADRQEALPGPGPGSARAGGAPAAAGEGATSRGLALSPALEARLAQLQERCAQLEAQLSGESGEGGSGGGGGGLSHAAVRQASKEYARLLPMSAAYQSLLRVRHELQGVAALLRERDPAMRAMALEEQEALQQQASSLTRELLVALVPADPQHDRPAILEVRAAAGGDEATLFAEELLRMYEQYARSRGWGWEVLEHAGNEVGGCRQASVAVGGEGAYGALSTESGVHRVQRVPATETQGRMHTSTACVVVLPQVEEADVEVREEDLRLETMRASGAGGQHVNVTDSAVRITHLPTGIVVSCQNERSQHQNKAAAMRVLRARVYDLEAQRRARELMGRRQAVIGTGDRNERIRTYHFSQDRVTDHRLQLTLSGVDDMMAGGRALGRFMEAAAEARTEAQLEQLAAAATAAAGAAAG